MNWLDVAVGGVIGAHVALIAIFLIARYRSIGGIRARERLRQWWNSGMSELPSTIGVRRDGQIVRMRPVRASGLHLVVEPLSGSQRTWETISAGEAADREEYWQIWKFLGGKTAGWVDDDGESFDPSE